MISHEAIYQKLLILLQKEGVEGSISLTYTDHAIHGDYSTNIAFFLGKHQNLAPKDAAQKFIPWLEEKLFDIVKLPIEVAGPGFINFFLKDEVIRAESKSIGKITTKFSGKKILVEHSSPNLFKPFHIGHLMNNIIGEFVARATSLDSKKVISMSFPSDVSLGIAKAMFIFEKDKEEGVIFDTKSNSDQIMYLGDCYVRGVRYFEEHTNEMDKAKEIVHIICDMKSQSVIAQDFLKAKVINNYYYLSTLKELGSDGFVSIFESQAGIIGKEIIESNTGDGKVFTKSEGAIVYIPPESRKDINTTVFVNSEGYSTYAGKDVGLLRIKFFHDFECGERYNPDYSFTVTDAEQISHFKVVFTAVTALGGEWISMVERSSKYHIPHGRMLFKGKKMSSRLGGVPLALDVISTVEEEVYERAGEKIRDYSQKEKEQLTREIALSALRVAVLRSKPGININFDPETSLSFEGDSGPYLLYTHARCFSLLEKGEVKNPNFDQVIECAELEKILFHYNQILKESVEDIAPQKLITYLFKVAQEFNSFYARTVIISNDKRKTEHNLAIVSWTKEVLRHGLYVLGIASPDRM